jgi:glutathione peroxidase
MSLKRLLLRLVYPLFRRISRRNDILLNEKNITAPHSFYSLAAESITGETISFHSLKGKKVLIVNTASDCGFIPQYGQLEALYNRYKAKLVIIGFPSNEFNNQEQGSNEAIKQFCETKYGISFPIAGKTRVLKTNLQHPVYQWLTDATMNGWNTKAPEWNFAKYLVDEQGNLMGYSAPAIPPARLAKLL